MHLKVHFYWVFYECFVSITVSNRANQESIQIEPILVEKICNPIQSHELLLWGGVIRMSLESVAIASQFGYILSGPIVDRKFSNDTTSACETRALPITKSMINVMTIDLKLDEIAKSLNKF